MINTPKLRMFFSKAKRAFVCIIPEKRTPSPFMKKPMMKLANSRTFTILNKAELEKMCCLILMINKMKIMSVRLSSDFIK